jgi:serine/threonine-protein kinase
MAESKSGILEIGTVLNEKWVILELIGKGGMGEVYRAHQLNLKRDVAIKILSEELLKTQGEDNEEIEFARARFRREVKVMAHIRHPNVVQIFDYGSATIRKDEDVTIEYIVMEHIPGSTLRYTMSEEGFFPDEGAIVDWILESFFPILDGVQALHEAGIVHRDLKPENFLLDGNTPKIADFGLARSFKLEPVTKSADMKGTLFYMSPEQFYDFRRADHRSDIYSLGKILFEAVEGKMPPNTIPFKRAKLNNPNTPFFLELDQIIKDATSEEKERRTATVERFRIELEETINRRKTEKIHEVESSSQLPTLLAHYKWIWVGITIAILSVAAMTVWHLVGDPWNREESFQKPKVSPQEVLKSPLPSSRKGKPGPGAIPAQSIMGIDGITMHLVPGGDLMSVPDAETGQRNVIKIEPFYIDETKITVHHFAEFLNTMKNSLNVENGLVKHEDKIWLLLGEGSEPYDQIIYRHGLFHLRKPEYAAQPVIRVTWFGASAYAMYYGERLPTEAEWEFAFNQDRLLDKNETPTLPEGSSHMMHMDSATDSDHEVKKPNQRNNQQDKETIPSKIFDIKEWIVRMRTNQAQATTSYSSLVIGITSLKKDRAQKDLVKSFRYPWEAFFDVGFRCVKSMPRKSDEP